MTLVIPYHEIYKPVQPPTGNNLDIVFFVLSESLFPETKFANLEIHLNKYCSSNKYLIIKYPPILVKNSMKNSGRAKVTP